MKRLVIILIIGFLLLGCLDQTSGNQISEQEYESTSDAVDLEEEDHQETQDDPEEAKVQDDTTEEIQPAEEIEIKSKEIMLKTRDSWKIYGTIYYAQEEKPTDVVVLLHALGRDRTSFDLIIADLHEAMPQADILALDIRGHGKSTNLGTWKNFIEGDFRAMKNDIAEVRPYMEMYRPSVEQYYIIGASIGSTIALNYAADNSDVKKVIMLSPGLEYKGVSIGEANSHYTRPLYVVVSQEDSYSVRSAQTIHDTSASDHVILVTYTEIGDAHGTDIIQATENNKQPLKQKILEWLT